MSRAQGIILDLMKERNLNFRQTSQLIGEVGQVTRNRLIVDDDMRADRFLMMLEALGCSLEIVDSGKMPAAEKFMERLKTCERWPGGIPVGVFYRVVDNGRFEVVDTRSGEPVIILTEDINKYN